MIVPLICSRVRTEEVVVSLVVHIPDKATLCLVENNGDRGIVVSTVLIFSLDELQQCMIYQSGSSQPDS